jgi:hypothetical protein
MKEVGKSIRNVDNEIKGVNNDMGSLKVNLKKLNDNQLQMINNPPKMELRRDGLAFYYLN